MTTKYLLTEPPVTLEDIWSERRERITELLELSEQPLSRSTLVNKVNLVKLYYQTGQLTIEASKIVGHPLFEKFALSLGRLEEIKSKILTLIYLNPMFNEENLLTHLNDYNHIDKVYLFTSNGLEVLNSETLETERVFTLDDTLTYSDAFYHKGRLYFIQALKVREDENSERLAYLDLESGQKVLIGISQRIKKIVGNLLYYLGSRWRLCSYNMDTFEITASHLILIGIPSSFDGNLLYVLNQRKKKFKTYDLSVTSALLVNEISISSLGIPPNNFVHRVIVSQGRLYLPNMNVFDTKTLELIGKIEVIPKYVHTFEGRIYVLTSKDSRIVIYDQETYRNLGELHSDNVTDSYYQVTFVSGNKLGILEPRHHLQVFDLNDGSSVTLEDQDVRTSFTIG